MASYSFLLSSLLLLTLALLSFFFIPTCSTSTTPSTNPLQKPPYRIPLHHVDSDKNLTKFELLNRAIKRDKQRLQSPVQSGDGDYLMHLAIGTPPLNFTAVIDTGSDLIWTQCKPCRKCFNQSTPLFDHTKSSSFAMLPCSSNLCKTRVTKCARNKCVYSYHYADKSSSKGTMATETFLFQNVSVANIVFGCGIVNKGDIRPAAGIIGLGRGPLSLVSQLDEPMFSYCLTSIDENSTSTLFLGRQTNEIYKSLKLTTPLFRKESYSTFYYLKLNGISVGDAKLTTNETVFTSKDDEDSDGGMIIDSGTTLTYLDDKLFDLVVDEFSSQTKLERNGVLQLFMGYQACYGLPDNGTKKFEYPKLVFHFEGADLDIPGESYVLESLNMLYMCLALSSGNTSIFGNLLQQNMLVVYDLQKEMLSFMPTKCGKM